MKEPLDRNQAMKLVSEIRMTGTVAYTGHAKTEMAADRMTMLDCVNVLRGGKITQEAELVHGTYRYRVHTAKMCVVVTFASETRLKIVTAWRKK